jgi:hypothetical protein
MIVPSGTDVSRICVYECGGSVYECGGRVYECGGRNHIVVEGGGLGTPCALVAHVIYILHYMRTTNTYSYN